MFYDRKYDAQLSAAAEAAGEAEANLGAGGGFGDDLGGDELGDEDLGDEDLGGEDLGDEELGGEEPAAEEDEGVLLAEPPAKRDIEEDGSYITKGAKGKRYTPAKRDKRKDSGPRKKNYKRVASPEISSRTTFPGWKGATGMNSIRNGLMEGQDSNYERKQMLEEKKLFDTNHEIHKLINGLESKENDK